MDGTYQGYIKVVNESSCLQIHVYGRVPNNLYLVVCTFSFSAVVDLNGRYFGGRVVKACFYNLDKFRVLDLGELV